MAWGKLESSFRDSPKWLRISSLLTVHLVQSAGHVAMLWAWSYSHAPDGFLGSYSVAEIEAAARWKGKKGALYAALKHPSVRVIDETNQGDVLHGFWERAESNKIAQRKKKQRETDTMSRPPSDGGHGEKRREEKRETQIEQATNEERVEPKQKIRDVLQVKFFIGEYNEIVANLGGAPALPNRGLDPYRADRIIEAARLAKVQHSEILAEWFGNSSRQTHTLEALDKATPEILERLTKRKKAAHA